MKTIKYRKCGRSTGVHVKFAQAMLDLYGYELSIDGSCGPKMDKAIRQYQADHGLVVDGSCGPATWRSLGFRDTKNPNIACIEIPFDKIEKANVLLKDKQKYSCMKFAKMNGGYDIVLNGGFFAFSDMHSVTCIYQNGKPQCWGNADSGVAFSTKDGHAKQMTRSEVSGKSYDLLCGAPVLIQNGVKDLDMEGISSSTYNAKTKRTCIGITSHSILLFFSLTNMILEDMLREGLNQKVDFMQGNDGGGSQSLVINENWVLTTDGRSIPSAVGIKLK